MVDQDPVDHRRVFYTPDWQQMQLRDMRPIGVSAPRPKRLDKLIAVAESLGRDLGFARVDLYEVDGEVFFGEITLAPNSGYMPFVPAEMDAILGRKWLAAQEGS
jgi:hypothetical protein